MPRRNSSEVGTNSVNNRLVTPPPFSYFGFPFSLLFVDESPGFGSK
jgi:hypothetical protein